MFEHLFLGFVVCVIATVDIWLLLREVAIAYEGWCERFFWRANLIDQCVIDLDELFREKVSQSTADSQLARMTAIFAALWVLCDRKKTGSCKTLWMHINGPVKMAPCGVLLLNSEQFCPDNADLSLKAFLSARREWKRWARVESKRAVYWRRREDAALHWARMRQERSLPA